MNDRLHNHPWRRLGVMLFALGACVPAKLDLFDTDVSGSASASGASTMTTGDATASAGSTASTTGDPTTGDPTTGTGATGDGPVSCEDPIQNCADDQDRDGVAFACDNAPHHSNPGQSDIDGDGIGDVIDSCPTIPNAVDQNEDADRDRIGNACDLCARPAAEYNISPDVPAYMRVRNIPQVEDSDHDGIGDACDNCVRTPNCQGYGDGLDPYTLGDPIDVGAADCQADVDQDGIGDACAGTTLPGAAGPVGFGPDDDFDQDGLANASDLCPRQPVAMQPCAGPEDCGDSGICTAGVCNHRDSDQDGVGDICDSCPWTENPGQNQEGLAEDDDLDGDFVGDACETHPLCTDYSDPRPFGFYDGSSEGYCCVQLSATGTVVDPHGETVPLPPHVLATPGVGVLPPGCTAEAQPLDPEVVGDGLWAGFCLLPQWDQDFDGVGDGCDLCRFAFDPDQETYVDEDDVAWPHNGKYCNGAFHPENHDPAMMCLPGT